MRIPFMALVLQGIPESIAMYTLAFIIAKASIEWRKIIAFGILSALISYFIRLFPITFGMHTIILMCLEFFMLIQFTKVTILNALGACLISFLALIFIETSFFIILTHLLEQDLAVLSESMVKRVLFTLPQVFVLFILAFIFYKLTNKNKDSLQI